jgi:hypothetical protein
MARPIVWSFSRSRSLGGCPRAHFLRYHSYGIPGLEDTPALSRLTSPEALAGDAVDYAARKVALHLSRGGRLPSEERIVAVGLGRYDERLSWRAHHTRNLMEGVEIPHEVELTALQHEYYGHEAKAGRGIGAMRERAEERLRNLAQSQLLRRLSSMEPSSLQISKSRRPRPRRFRRLSVYAQPDLLVRTDERLMVIDWKAGDDGHRPRTEAGWQLAAYASIEGESAGVGISNVGVQAAFLASAPEWDPQPAREQDVQELVKRIERDVVEEANYASAANECKEGLAAWRESARVRTVPGICARCPFLELCPEGTKASTSVRLPNSPNAL